ncbi:glycosyltransferase family 4 protein [Chromobacterium sphagni]|uniref:glycosyltransferase family 4 protein n=1 Tax=Chromobacterium sphagni TaxID=1903179 RepID=UPI0009F3F5E7|nr:glycosyltransferase family 4 protein [Chromobacterium sphagni]
MKVLIWSQYFWPENFLINKLATQLAGDDVEITVVTGKPNYPDGNILPGYSILGIQREDYSGIEVIRIPLLPRGSGSAIGLILNYLSFIFSGYLMAPFALRGREFDAVFVYAPSPLLQALPAVFISWLKRAKLAVWVQDLWPESLWTTGFVRNRFLLKLVEYVVRYIYRYSDSVLIQSHAFRDPVARLVSDKSKIRYFPNFCEDLKKSFFDSESPGSIAAEMHRHFSVVFAGNIGTVQSCETIIAAAKLLKENSAIKFYLVGSGSRSAFIQSEVESEQLDNVILTGRLSQENMPPIFSAASILLVTLKDDSALSTTIPSKLQSYLSAGKPIVASLNGEPARIVEEAGAGIVCPAESPELLAQAVLKFYQMPVDERERFGTNARIYFKKHFDQETRVKELEEHFRELMCG